MPPTADASDIVRGSFRDPSGQVFERGGRLLRRINRIYTPNYDRLIASGLYSELVDRRLLVPHDEVDLPAAVTEGADKVIEPERIPFISYPFEWTFGQLKAAALATLEIQRLALDRGMVLKDASAYNIQFRGLEPVLIDTLSFEIWREGSPWVAYRQFCQHFLAPLALMAMTDGRLGVLTRSFIDGIPLDLASGLLPLSTKLSPPLLVHLHLHARAQARHGGEPLDDRGSSKFGRRSMLGLIDHLASAIDRLKLRTSGGSWADYYDRTNYSADAMSHKKRIVEAFVERARPAMTWDFGSNTGAFSRLASLHSGYTVAFDADRTASERHFDDCCARREARVLPLVMDLANPSGGIGWAHAERQSLAERGPADLVLALGLIHHLRLTNHVPFAAAADYFHRIGRAVVIELADPADSQVRTMLSRQPSLASSYSRAEFERAFARFFSIVEVQQIFDTERRLYLMGTRAR